ncbi:SpoIID/LytB domain protein [Lachnospiraceae bacterium KM106-2]|nr:SpoIID/LytB domain protein [Lachnospiraceae bacterium KM106-2]
MNEGNKTRLILIGICFACMVMVFARNVTVRLQATREETSVSAVNGDKGITHAQAAKMLSLLAYTTDELDGLERSHTYKDSKQDDWYDRYINGLVSMGLGSAFSANETTFGPMDKVTYTELDQLIQLIQKEKKVTLNKVNSSKQGKQNIGLNDFTKLYDQLIKNVYLHKENGQTVSYIKKKELYVIGIPEQKKETNQKVSTDQGQYEVNGIDAKNYVDHTLKAYVSNSELVAITGTVDKKVTIHNAYILKMDGKEITAFINGIKRVFMAKSEVSEKIETVVADLVITNQKVTKITLKPEKIKAKVLSISKDSIDLEKYGTVKLDDDFKVYQIYGELMAEAPNSILVGYSNCEFVMTHGKICAALITDSLTAKNIRVLIRNNGYDSVYHKKVTVTSDENFIVSYGNGKNRTEKKYEAGEKVTIKTSNKMLASGRLEIKTESDSGKVKITSIVRAKGSPSYRGTIEIVKRSGKLTVVNELPLEEYLYAVVPSEMPVSYGLEALKTQAICARSYAYNHLAANSCSAYGAHVDDSTAYQVYNNHGEDKLAKQAVDETRGKVLQYQGKVIFAYYYSTSCGNTSSVSDVWVNKKTIPYLVGHFQSSDGKKETKDFSSDQAFREFLTSNKEEMLDEDYPWYRWNVKISYDNLTKMVDRRLKDIYNKKSDYVKTLNSDGKYYERAIDTIGTVQKIKVIKRAKSGLVSRIEIVGSDNTVRVTSESFIRQILAPMYDTVIRKDGTKVKNLNLLPSSFFVIDSNADGIQLYGGGYGHGVGMSQNGVKSLVKLGMTCEEILKHYYDNIEIGTIY